MTDENADILRKLGLSVVEIISDKEDSSTLGTGFVVTDDGLIVTCRHVVIDSQDKLMNTVKVRFHSDGNTAVKFTAIPVKDDQHFKDDPSIDIAFLKLDKLPEKGVTPVKLDDKVVSLNEFATIGFRKPHEFSGLVAQGNIGILTRIKPKESLLSTEVIQLYHKKQIAPGMSGAPVLDLDRGRVVGIITERYKPIDFTDEDTLAFALPVRSMLDLCPILQQVNQGLTVLSKFLLAIGEERSSIYKWIDDVYVPPIEYEDIKAALKRDRIVFITGTKEFGKTFTAVQLLYEFFKEEGYQPRWLKERKQQGSPEGADPQELARISQEIGYIKPHEIVYFEDPFGKTKYESSSFLENYIGSIMDNIRAIQDAYVIITSREEVFKQFEKEQLSEIKLANFEKKMNLKRASYSIEMKKEMLDRWAKVYNSKWLLDSKLANLVIEAIEKQQLLPTPLNIKDFVIASHDVLDSEQLRNLIKQKSEETVRRFADEIIRMKMDEEVEKVLVLAFAYVGRGRLDVELVRKMYESISTESTQKHYMDFESVKKWFEGDKINISDNKIAFSHPSYHEAFRYAIRSEKHHIAGIRDLFVEVLLRLVDEDKAAWMVADPIADNFNNMPPHVQQLLTKLADNDKAARYVTEVIDGYFDNLPYDFRNELLLKAWIHAPVYTSRIVAYRYDKLNNEARNILLEVTQAKKYDDEAFANIVIANLDKIPYDVRDKLFLILVEHGYPYIGWDISEFILRKTDTLHSDVMGQLLLKLADNDFVVPNVSKIIKFHFDKLPPRIRSELLLKLVRNKRYIPDEVPETIASNFDKLPENATNLLSELVNTNISASARIIASNFDKLPDNMRNLLFTMLDTAPKSVASAVSSNFDKLPYTVRNELLFALCHKNEAIEYVALTIASNFDKLPDQIKKMFFKMAEEDDKAGAVASAILTNYEKVPNIVRNLLVRLAEKGSIAAAKVITSTYQTKIPEKMKAKLYEKFLLSGTFDKNIKLNPNDDQAYNTKALALVALNRYDEALECIDKTIEISPHIVYLLNKANLLLVLGRYEEAIEYCDKVISIREDKALAWVNKGNALNNLGRYEQAVQCYDKATEIDSNDGDAWYNKGNALFNLSEYGEAIVCYNKALELNPNSEQLWVNKGDALYELERHEEAIVCYDKAIEVKPNYIHAWNNKGLALSALEIYQDAIKSYDKALEIDPNYVDALKNKGLALHDSSNDKEAIACYNKALTIDSNDTYAFYNRARSKAKIGYTEKALADLKKAFEINRDLIEIAKQEKDFKRIRNDKRFKALVKKRKKALSSREK